MKCNVCQDDMISSKSGWLCLNCGNSIGNKPAETPLIIGESVRRDNEEAPVIPEDSKPVITDSAALTSAALPVVEATPTKTEAEAPVTPTSDAGQAEAATVTAVEVVTPAVAVTDVAATPEPASADVTGHDESADVDAAIAAAALAESAAQLAVASAATDAPAEQPEVPVSTAEAAGNVAPVTEPSVAESPAGQAAEPVAASEVEAAAAPTEPDVAVAAPAVAAEAPEAVISKFGSESAAVPDAAAEPTVSETTPIAAPDTAPDAVSTTNAESESIVEVTAGTSPQASDAPTEVPASELTVPGTAGAPVATDTDDMSAKPIDGSAETSEAGDQPAAALAAAPTPDLAAVEPEPAPAEAAAEVVAEPKTDLAPAPSSLASDAAPTLDAAPAAGDVAASASAAVPTVKPAVIDGAIDGLGASRGSAVLNLKPATEPLARPVDRSAPAVDSIGRLPVSAGELHATSLSVPPMEASVAAATPGAQATAPAAVIDASSSPATAAPSSGDAAPISPTLAETPPAAEAPAPAETPAAPLASHADALKQALGADVADRIAKTEAQAASSAKAPDFWDQIAAPPKPKAPTGPVPKQAIAGVITGVALIAVVFGGFYFFGHTSGTTTAKLPNGSTGYSGTSLARVTSGGADAGTKADVAMTTPLPSATPTTPATLPGGQTDATRLAGRDNRRKADVASYAAAYKKTATNGYYLTNAPAVTVDAADPSTAKPYTIQSPEVTATGQIRYWAGGQCAAKPVTPGATSTRYLALQTKLEDGTVYCLDVK